MTGEAEPLGPKWERPLTCEELRGRLAAGVAVARPLPVGKRLVHGCELYTRADATGGSARRSVCVLGAFDGVHVGHRELVRTAVAEARERGLASVAVTFAPDPAAVLAGPIVNDTLLSIEDRVRMLLRLGLDAVLVVPFTRELAATSHGDFLREWLVPCVGPASIHVGSDFRMGAGGVGTVGALREVAAPLGIDVHGHELVSEQGHAVSATLIRGLVRDGKVEQASRLLERDHMVRGLVEHGRGEGASFGFPTANVPSRRGGLCRARLRWRARLARRRQRGCAALVRRRSGRAVPRGVSRGVLGRLVWQVALGELRRVAP